MNRGSRRCPLFTVGNILLEIWEIRVVNFIGLTKLDLMLRQVTARVIRKSGASFKQNNASVSFQQSFYNHSQACATYIVDAAFQDCLCMKIYACTYAFVRKFLPLYIIFFNGRSQTYHGYSMLESFLFISLPRRH